MKSKEILSKKLDLIFEHLTQNELAEKLGITQWTLLEKMKDTSFNKSEFQKISNYYREFYLTPPSIAED